RGRGSSRSSSVRHARSRENRHEHADERPPIRRRRARDAGRDFPPSPRAFAPPRRRDPYGRGEIEEQSQIGSGGEGGKPVQSPDHGKGQAATVALIGEGRGRGTGGGDAISA